MRERGFSFRPSRAGGLSSRKPHHAGHPADAPVISPTTARSSRMTRVVRIEILRHAASLMMTRPPPPREIWPTCWTLRGFQTKRTAAFGAPPHTSNDTNWGRTAVIRHCALESPLGVKSRHLGILKASVVKTEISGHSGQHSVRSNQSLAQIV